MVPLKEALKSRGVAAACIIAGGALIAGAWYSGNITAPTSLFMNEPAPHTTTEEDADNNGVPDWKEHAIPLPQTNNTNDSVVAHNQPTYTKTEALAGDLFGEYLDKKSTDTLNEKNTDAIISNALNHLTPEDIPQYTQSSVAILNTDTDEDARAYSEKIKAVIATLDAIPEYELETYARATEKNSAAEFEQVAKDAHIYAQAVTTLKTVSVPKGAVDAHLSLMNAFATLAVSLKEMSRGYDDIAASYAALKTFSDAEKNLDVAYALHKSYLTLHNALTL